MEHHLFRSLSGVQETSQLVETDGENRTLGTLKGVFAPVSLSLFSALLFLRVGYIVGNAGFLSTVLLFVIAYTILISTVVSICAIATNGAVQGGGVYFMLSRTMGPEFGGSIGVLFYFANVVGSALNVTACTEGLISNFGPMGAFMAVLPGGKWWKILYSTLFNVLNLCLSLIGAELFGKASVMIFVLVTACTGGVFASFFLDSDYSQSYTTHQNMTINGTIVSTNVTVTGTFTGLSANTLEGITSLWQSNLYPNYDMDCQNPSQTTSVFGVFGVLFSGVTGIMAGANMSGELLSPGKAIPVGTLSGCFFTFFTYILLSLLTSLTCNVDLLQHDCTYMLHLTFCKELVLIGVILATWSASLSNFIGASRVLQAVAKDSMFGPILEFINYGTVRGNPMLAVVTTGLLTQLFFFIGGLNQIAQLCSVLFLLSYGCVNLACLGLELASAPNFRPSFKHFSWQTSLVGLTGTSVMMFLINPIFASISIILCLVFIFVLHMFSPARNQNWGSMSQALIFHQVRKYLLLLDPRKETIMFWRPQMLLLVRSPRSACSLIDFVNSMKKGGLYILGHIKVGTLGDEQEDVCYEEQDSWLSLVDHLNVKAFVEMTLASSVRAGSEQLIRVSGIGAMKANTILMAFRDSMQHTDDLSKTSSTYFNPIFEESFLPVGNRNQAEDSEGRINSEEYVGIIQDTLKLNKNIVLCRNFQHLDRKEIFESGTKKYLDVWPVNFFGSQETDLSDNTGLFLLQLATIVKTVPAWSCCTLRVFVVVGPEDRNVESKKKAMVRLLDLLRITAQTVVLVWHHLNTSSELQEDLHNMTHDYLREANDLIGCKSEETAVSFLYLPLPPRDARFHTIYLWCLDQLTANLTPLLLVRGVHPVIT